MKLGLFAKIKLGIGGILYEDMPRVFRLAKTASYELLKNQNKFLENAIH